MKIIVLAAFFVLTIIYGIGSFLNFCEQENELEKHLEEVNEKIRKLNEFKVSDYLSHIEQEAVDIQRNKENRPKKRLTLWWGLDGLRLNDDGTSEWIRRDEHKPQTSPSTAHKPQFNYSPCQSVSQVTDSRIAMLQAQMQNTCIQYGMSIQNQQIISQLYPQYQYAPCYYGRTINQSMYYGNGCFQ